MNNYNLIVYAIEQNFTLKQFEDYLNKSLEQSNSVNIYEYIKQNKMITKQTFDYYKEQNKIKSRAILKQYKKYLKEKANAKQN